MTPAAHPEAPKNSWIEDFRVERQGSFLRLIFSFRISDPQKLQVARSSLAGGAGDWKPIVEFLRSEARLAEHAAELVREPDGGLSVHKWNLRDSKSVDPVPHCALVRLKKTADDASLVIDAVETWLFELGFGYLVFEVRLDTPDLRRWLALLHWSRHLDSKRCAKLLIEGSELTFEAIAAKLLGTLAPGAWWEPIDIPRTLRSYFSLCVARADSLGMAPVGRCEPDLQRRLLYHVCEQAPPHRLLHLPTGTARGDFVRGDSFEYAEGVHFVASREGVAYVAIDRDMQDEFWGKTMVGHLRTAYFLHYLVTQYQRHAIEGLRRAVESAERDQRISDEEWRKVKDHSARVRSAGFFVELARTNNHSRFERLVRDMAQVDRLFDLTTRAVDDLVAMKIEGIEAEQARRQTEQARRQQELQERWAWIGTPIAVTSLFLGFMSMNLRGWTTEGEGLSIDRAFLLVLGVAAIGTLGGFLIARKFRRL